MTHRKTDLPIDPIFLKRWSPRAFDSSPMPEPDLLTLIEAARWAPSAFNVQPWRFLYALRGDAQWQNFLELLDSFNIGWAQNASALVFLLSDRLMFADEPGKAKPSRCHSFDAGAAWAQLALQATRMGYQAHGMAGIDYDLSRIRLQVPERYRIEIAIAVGRRADAAALPAELQEREFPSPRRPIDELAFAGGFPRQTGNSH
ncbi:nitroreductase family protein [Pelagibius sp. Alg239-R121]|uniref:nitroreductase family protein n=1 Tax=Pelagibius sp. Alg239-R121 TaxID=2993448 RepID=UPI0024A6CC92|nr:nitroreductase family protein [Pelagibius sp. Alg239-R121]